MQKSTLLRNAQPGFSALASGKPTMPQGRQPFIERKVSDPSSCPKVEKCPVPSVDYRIKTRDFDSI